MSVNHLEQILNKAEIKAKQREFANSIDLTIVAKEVQKANEQNVGIYIKEPKNKAEFTIINQDNLLALIQKKYLTNAERTLIFDLSALVELHSNAITNEKGQFLTVSEIARILGRNVSATSTLINQLIKKGIIYEFVDINELKEFKRSVSSRPFFFNPEIVFCGDRNKINATLCKLVLNSDRLEKNKVYLNWKLWIHPHEKYGALYKRETYLKFKKMR